MKLEKRAQILEVITLNLCCVRDLIKKLNWKTSDIINLLRSMNKERLIKFNYVKNTKRGRPKKYIICLPLGFEFLETYRKLKVKPLRASRKDLENAVKDALYTERLINNGYSPIKLFVELNIIARNINFASEASEII
ncbi:MAG: hypothetical protein HWN67_01100 [Candidatus Helarchaeota archaeon]|nr:hypothetical protein [Candidatus Helarchaeota archaeon]